MHRDILLPYIPSHIFPVNIQCLDQCDWAHLLKITVNHRTQIKQCGQVFHMQRIDHHTPVQSYLDIFRSWQKNKNYNTELDVKKTQIPFTTVMLA